jgi:hypothetical protein
MPHPLQTDLQTLLPLIRTKLVNDGIADTSRVYLGLYPEHLDPETADVFIVITPGRQVAEQPNLTGSGNFLLFFQGEVHITIYCRLVLDAGDRADNFLTDKQFGCLPVLKCVYNSLNMYQPIDLSGNQYIAEPFRIIAVDRFERATEVPGWGRINTTWDLNWHAELNCD